MQIGSIHARDSSDISTFIIRGPHVLLVSFNEEIIGEASRDAPLAVRIFTPFQQSGRSNLSLSIRVPVIMWNGFRPVVAAWVVAFSRAWYFHVVRVLVRTEANRCSWLGHWGPSLPVGQGSSPPIPNAGKRPGRDAEATPLCRDSAGHLRRHGSDHCIYQHVQPASTSSDAPNP